LPDLTVKGQKHQNTVHNNTHSMASISARSG